MKRDTGTRFQHLAQEWADARRARLVETRAMNKFWCQDRERPEYDTGSDGRAACYRLWATVDDEWCDSCRARDPHFQAMLELRRTERARFRRLCAFVNRLGPVPCE